MVQYRKYIIFFLVFLFASQIGMGQKESLHAAEEFEFSIAATCQTCGGFGNTKIILTEKNQKRSILKIEQNQELKKIKLKKDQFYKVRDSLIAIINQVELLNFNDYDHLFYSLIPKEQNEKGYPKQLLRIDDGRCYSVRIQLQGELIKFDACNPEAEFDLISQYSKAPNEEILDLLGEFIKLLKLLRKELDIEI